MDIALLVNQPADSSDSSDATKAPTACARPSIIPPSLVAPGQGMQRGASLRILPEWSSDRTQSKQIGEKHTSIKKREASRSPSSDANPAKKSVKWTDKEDELIIELRDEEMIWEKIAEQLPGRSSLACRLHYQNYLEKRLYLSEPENDKFARLYDRFKPQMWQTIAKEMRIPWRFAESMHWRLGKSELSTRANKPILQTPQSESGVLECQHDWAPSLPLADMRGDGMMGLPSLMGAAQGGSASRGCGAPSTLPRFRGGE